MSDMKYAVYVGKESVRESLCKDFMTLFTVSFLVGISVWGDSVFWTLVTGGIFLLWFSGRIKSATGEIKKFKTKEELHKWVDSLKE